MEKRKKQATIGIAALGTLVALGYAYKKHNNINNGLKGFDRKVKNSVDKNKFNLLRWKDNVTLNTLVKAENKVRDLKDRTTSVRDIAW
tara:strand:+ start:1664 stop:1927 length:264 start_codon:yes stop_codon:yes gene_type:complete